MVGTSPTMTICAVRVMATKLGARFLAILALLMLAWSAGPGYAADADWSAVEAAAKKSGKLMLYLNLPPPGDEGVVAAFQEAYPDIKVEMVRLGSGAMMQRFSAETAAGACPADALMTNYDVTENS